MAEARLHVIPNPLINITLQGRHDGYPKRRGMTRVKELMAAGVNVAFGHDCVMDPWYPLGSHDMLEVAHMGLHVGQMTGRAEMLACFDAVTVNGAKALGLEDYGLQPGRSEEHPSELQALMRTSYAAFCLRKKTTNHIVTPNQSHTRNETRPRPTQYT